MKSWNVLLWLGFLTVGCGTTATESDCAKIGDNLRTAWMQASSTAPPADKADTERAATVIKREEGRLVSDWLAQCRRDLAGRRVDARQMRCLRDARSMTQLKACAELP